jgi:hypothetical protein
MSETTGQAIAEASAAVTSISTKTAVGGSIAGLSGKFLGLDPITAIGLPIEMQHKKYWNTMIFQISNRSINLNGFGSMIRTMQRCFMLKVLRAHF